MKKSLKSCIAFLALLTALLSGASAKSNPTVKTEVASIDKHGNVNLAVSGTLFSAQGFGLGDLVSVKVGSVKFDAPTGKNYTDVDHGAYILRINGEEVSLAINLGNFADKTGATVGTPVTVTMKERLGYLRTYQARLLSKSSNRSDFDSDETFANFRAVKGGALAENRLFRSCNPVESDERAPFAAALAEKAGVAVVLNLSDTEEEASGRIADFPYYQKLSNTGSVKYVAMGASFTDKNFASHLHDGLSYLAKRQGPYYIHGKEGRTRTGMLCSLLAALCGASMEELKEDYMQSYVNYYHVRPDTVQYASLAQAVPDFFKALNGGRDVSDKNLQAVAEKYLLKTVKLSAEEIEAIRKGLCK